MSYHPNIAFLDAAGRRQMNRTGSGVEDLHDNSTEGILDSCAAAAALGRTLALDTSSAAPAATPVLPQVPTLDSKSPPVQQLDHLASTGIAQGDYLFPLLSRNASRRPSLMNHARRLCCRKAPTSAKVNEPLPENDRLSWLHCDSFSAFASTKRRCNRSRSYLTQARMT